MALPIWANYMKACYADSTLVVSKDEFMAPDVVSIPLDCDSLSVARQQKSFFEDEDLSDLGL
jgi:penicillin-binding protein 1A